MEKANNKNNNQIEDKIIDLLDRMRPFLMNDGGDLEFVEYKDHKVYIRLVGACKDCNYIDITLKDGIQEMITTEIPEVEEVVNVD